MRKDSAYSRKRGRLRVLGKRGMDDKIMFLIWEVIAIAMISLVLVMAVKGIANNTTYWKKYHSADLSMTTELALTNQGDFQINYNLKEIHSKFLTNIIGINKPAFQVFLKDGSYKVYGISASEDRFPQSFIFASNPFVKITESNASKDYLILHKSSDTFSMDAGQIVISCPAPDISFSLNEAKFRVTSLDDAMESYSGYIDKVLDVYGKNDEKKEFLIGISSDDKVSNSTTIYYDSEDASGSQRMACLLHKCISGKYPEMDVEHKEYEGSTESKMKLEQSAEGYAHWMIISVGKDGDTLAVIDKDMGDCMEDTVKEYYGEK